MRISICCPFCGHEFIGDKNKNGICVNCKEEYQWEENCVDSDLQQIRWCVNLLSESDNYYDWYEN